MVNLQDLADSPRQQSVGFIPFFAQSDYQCGPASLAGMLSASGVEIEPDELKAQIYLPERRGSLQIELLAASRRAGRIPYRLNPEIRALMEEIQAGHPVLVLQNRNWRYCSEMTIRNAVSGPIFPEFPEYLI